MARIMPFHSMRKAVPALRYRVRLWIQVLGPVRSRTKHKEHKAFSAEQCIMLPFVPYPGMGLTLERKGAGKHTSTLYLRIRYVEWQVPAEAFWCTVDEVLGDPSFDDRYEARGSARIEEHYVRLQRELELFGFVLTMNTSVLNKVKKYADGRWIDPVEAEEDERLFHHQLREWRQRGEGASA